jgi:hypothetical protein
MEELGHSVFTSALIGNAARLQYKRSLPGLRHLPEDRLQNFYKDEGLETLTDRSRRPVRYANRLPEPIERMIVRLKKDKPHWGARKIREHRFFRYGSRDAWRSCTLEATAGEGKRLWLGCNSCGRWTPQLRTSWPSPSYIQPPPPP